MLPSPGVAEGAALVHTGDALMSEQTFAGRTALVTGAGSGIGAAISIALAGAGARVICAGRTLAKVQAVAEGIGANACAVALDVTDGPAVAALPGSLPAGFREVDILVNNAGHDAGGRCRFDEGSAEQWADIIDTNVIGTMRVTRALLPGMVARDRGYIVNLGSTAGLQPYAGGGAYSSSKHAVHGFSESLRLDLARTGVRVSEIQPGMVRTRFAFARWPGDAERAQRFYDDRPCLAPEDIARAVLFVLGLPDGVEIPALLIRPKGEG